MKSLRKPLQRIRSQYEVVSRGEPCHQHHYDNLAIFPPMIVVAVQLVAAGKRSDTLRRPGSLSAAPGSQAGRHMRLVTSRDDSFPQICPELVQAETKSGTCLEGELYGSYQRKSSFLFRLQLISSPNGR
ncbi:hypothetical protein ABZX51_000906 [Aspergillus tubingensis]